MSNVALWRFAPDPTLCPCRPRPRPRPHPRLRAQVAALRSHASECAAEAERAQRSALQSDAVHAASSAEEVAQLREQVMYRARLCACGGVGWFLFFGGDVGWVIGGRRRGEYVGVGFIWGGGAQLSAERNAFTMCSRRSFGPSGRCKTSGSSFGQRATKRQLLLKSTTTRFGRWATVLRWRLMLLLRRSQGLQRASERPPRGRCRTKALCEV